MFLLDTDEIGKQLSNSQKMIQNLINLQLLLPVTEVAWGSILNHMAVQWTPGINIFWVTYQIYFK